MVTTGIQSREAQQYTLRGEEHLNYLNEY